MLSHLGLVGRLVGMVGIAKREEAVDVCISPVAVQMVVRGAVVSMQRSGAVFVK